MDLIHHTFNDVEIQHHISVKKSTAVYMTLAMHREEIYVSRKPIFAITDNQVNQLRFDTLKITQKGTAKEINFVLIPLKLRKKEQPCKGLREW